jgi:uncharacterized protein (TIGR03086 family)
MTIIEQFIASQELFSSLVNQVQSGDGHKPTPCTDWDVRALVNHMANENIWIPDLFAGKTVAEVGDKYDGDILGDNPKQTWDTVVAAAKATVLKDGALEKTVHLSYGDSPAERYLTMLMADHVIHSWDLSKAIGAEYQPSDELVHAAWEWMSPQADRISGSSFFGPRVEVSADAPIVEQLIGLAGRHWDWAPK